MGDLTAQHVVCPACGQRYPWRDALAGRKLRCICHAKFRMPPGPSQAPTLLENTPAGPAGRPRQPADRSRSRQGGPSPRTRTSTVPPNTNIAGKAPTARVADAAPAHAIRSLHLPSADHAATLTCPSCERQLRPGVRICVTCGIDVHTGRSIITSSQVDENLLHGNAETVIRGLSFAVPFGLYPLASEAYGSKTPWTIRTVALLTLLVSVWFFAYLWTGGDGLQTHKRLMLWPQGEPTAMHVRDMYTWTDYGNMNALVAEVEAIQARQAATEAEAGDHDAAGTGTGVAAGEAEPLSDEQMFQQMLQGLMLGSALAEASDATIIEAHGNLTPRQRAVDEFRWYQLLTHAMLHDGILHLAGNMLFLLVFGLRVNAMVGNLATALLYPVLAVAAAGAHMLATAGEPPVPMLGASGAIWGLAGMYLVLFPVHRVYNALWFRWPVFPLIMLMRLHMKIFACRGFWVVLFFISFDVLAVAMGWHGATAHWAHLGGFLAGVAIALVLLSTRRIDAGGGDVLSVTLGKSAWWLLGSPAERARAKTPSACVTSQVRKADS